MEYNKELISELRAKIKDTLTCIQADQEKRPLHIARELGYLLYVRLFVESQKRESLQNFFPYAGFPMEWSGSEENMDAQARAWQLQYQIQYCSSIVEEGHFMEMAQSAENPQWIQELCKLIDWVSDRCGWGEEMPQLFGIALEIMIDEIYDLGVEGFFLMPENLCDMLLSMANVPEDGRVWDPSSRTGSFLAAAFAKHKEWELHGTETDKEQCLLANMLLFYLGSLTGKIENKDPLEEQNKYQLIISNPPVGELDAALQDRFSVTTRKKQLQYLQMVMEQLEKQGQAIIVVNEGTLFKFDAEMRVRQKLVDEYELQGVISFPAGAFLPYTGSKASVLIFANAPEKVSESLAVWFYELHDPGYTLDRKRETTTQEEIEKLLTSWRDRKELEVEWKRQLVKGEKKNQWENPVPETWPEVHYWFADRKTIRQNDYNLTAGRYKPWKESASEILESPMVLLDQLSDLEQETMEQIKELIEMTRKYG
ncbi:MAG: hypothetical protein EOM40_00360 [Clostridia bacterium]|nr:hypothetical protein [Clostridia bacterium]NCC44504.1 hypothetical protein [Clostridia bacterium]